MIVPGWGTVSLQQESSARFQQLFRQQSSAGRHAHWEYSVSRVPLLPQPADGNNLTLCFKNFSPELIYWRMPACFFPPATPPPTKLVHLFSFRVTRRLSGLPSFSVGLTQLSLAGECVCEAEGFYVKPLGIPTGRQGQLHFPAPGNSPYLTGSRKSPSQSILRLFFFPNVVKIVSA